jgi:protein-disulfide isomerase
MNKYTVPISILIAGLVVGGALVISKLQKGTPDTEVSQESLATIPLLNADDHYLGNPKASIVIIEYSDYDCPFCAGYFNNMKKIVEELGKSGRLVWVHRHMPLYQIHPTAREKAQVVECSAEIGGEEKFWEVSGALYKETLAKDGKTAINTVLEVGLPKIGLEECLRSEKYLQKILAQYDEAFTAGARGTPFTVIINGEERLKLEESLAYFELRKLIESLLSE